ncbi:hypothetical protein TSAR_011050, partial [Trichomalopsis sarcophagae]
MVSFDAVNADYSNVTEDSTDENMPEAEEEEDSPPLIFRGVQILPTYMGSFPVAGFDAACRAEYLRAKLELLRAQENRAVIGSMRNRALFVSAAKYSVLLIYVLITEKNSLCVTDRESSPGGRKEKEISYTQSSVLRCGIPALGKR